MEKVSDFILKTSAFLIFSILFFNCDNKTHDETEKKVEKEILTENRNDTTTKSNLYEILKSFYGNKEEMKINRIIITSKFDFNSIEYFETVVDTSKNYFKVYLNAENKIISVCRFDNSFCNYELSYYYYKDCAIMKCNTFWKDKLHKKYKNTLKGFFLNDLKKKFIYFISLNTSFGNDNKDNKDLLNNVSSISCLDQDLNVKRSFFYLAKDLLFNVYCEYDSALNRIDNVNIISPHFCESGTKLNKNYILHPDMNLDDIENVKFISCDYTIGLINVRVKDNLPSWYWNNKIY